MLPILRILPVGGVFLAILILGLALTPPGARPLPLAPVDMAARGALIDRNEHPEWRQVLIQAALRRADELIRLRDLPDLPVITEEAAPAASQPVIAATPVIAPQPKIAPSSVIASAPVINLPHADAAPSAAVSPEETATAPVQTTKVAGLPSTRIDADPDRDSITGTIEESPGATIPVEIGEASSIELPVVLPPERPPILRTPERVRPAHESRRKQPKRIVRAKAPVKPRAKPQAKTQATLPPLPRQQTGLFESVFNGRQNQRTAAGSAGTSAPQPAAPRAESY